MSRVEGAESAREVDKLKEDGFWIVGTSAKADKDNVWGDRLTRAAGGVVIGSEGKGISNLLQKKWCISLVRIPVTGQGTLTKLPSVGSQQSYYLKYCVKDNEALAGFLELVHECKYIMGALGRATSDQGRALCREC